MTHLRGMRGRNGHIPRGKLTSRWRVRIAGPISCAYDGAGVFNMRVIHRLNIRTQRGRALLHQVTPNSRAFGLPQMSRNRALSHRHWFVDF